jgi:hypothetical protein
MLALFYVERHKEFSVHKFQGDLLPSVVDNELLTGTTPNKLF